MVTNTPMTDEAQVPNKKRSYKQAFDPRELENKFSSKLDMVTYFRDHLQLFMPAPSAINRDFLRQVLNGSKDLMSLS